MYQRITRSLFFLSTFTAFCIFAKMGSPLQASTVELDASKDNTLYEDASGSLSNGAGIFLFAGQTSSNLSRRAVVAFDLAAIPAGSIIDEVEVSFETGSKVNAAHDFSLHKLTRDWGEGTSDASGQEGGGTTATTGDATWIHAFSPGPADNWTAAGGDFVSAASATKAFGGNENITETFSSTSSLVADVQGWLDNGDNFGWILIGNEATTRTAYQFHSRSNVSSKGPSLTVTFTPIPEPATIALAAFASLGMLARRRC